MEVLNFDNFDIRTIEDGKDTWYSVIDVVAALSNSSDARSYWKTLKGRLKKEGSQLVTDCHQFKLEASDGKMRSTDCLDREGVLRLIQSIPSPNAEPFKLWLANAGNQIIEETEDPAILAERYKDALRQKGYDDNWILTRIRSIEIRTQLTEEWQNRNVRDEEFALLTNEIIEFVAQSERFVPHFHIPLQSGNNKQLKQMRRRYKRELYADRVKKIKEVMPHACIGVDVIVGFPGETDAHFLETYNFLNELDISYLHVFTYSERDNTTAATMEGVVPKNVRSKRSKMLRGLSVKKRRAFYESQLGTQRTVLFEGENKEGYIHGFTENYIKVKAPWNPELVNTLHDINLTKIGDDGIVRFDFVTIEVH